MIFLTRRATFSASHYYWNDSWPAEKNERAFGLCANRNGHGHNYIVEVTLDHHDEETLDHFGTLLTAYPEVLEAYLTTGEYDYLIKVAVEGTSGYEKFLRERLYRLPGIRHSRTSFTLRCLKRMVSVLP